MKMIGITGAMGSGKSTVAEILGKRGWHILSSDATARELMDTSTEVQQLVAEALGHDVLVDGVLNRQLIAQRVFGPTTQHHQALQKLNAIIHPRVLEQHLKQLEELRSTGTEIVAVESALLYEVGLEDGFDWVVVVSAPEEDLISRAMKRSNISRAEVEQRMAQQMQQQEKRALADFVIDNAHDLAALEKATNTVATIIEALPDPESTHSELDE